MPRKALLQQGHIAAPFGINVVSPASAIPETDGLILLNCVAGDRGLKPRQGFQEWVTGVGASSVRSIIPYHGTDSGKDRLFATASDKIYNCTTSTGAPATAHTFTTADANSGHGVWQTYVTAAGAHSLLYADETNGYLVYDETTDLWAAGSTTGIAPGDVRFVMQWKRRVFLVKKNSTEAWYLGVDAISGAATKFDFGPLFRAGGYLVGLWTWTVDGGAGMDDFLVAISSSGDVVVFAGSDPSSSNTFQQLGEWSTGGVPAGRRIATQFGGDILILTLLGILPLSKLVGGQLVTPDTYETYKIRPLFNQVISEQQSLLGWEMLIHPQDNFLFLNTPGVVGNVQEQFAMSYATRGWARFRGLDVYSAGIWRGSLYFGTRNGRVCKSTGFLDNVARDGSTTNAIPVESVVLSSFQTLQSANKKMLRVIRPLFIVRDINPSVQCFARYDFDMRDVTGVISAPSTVAGGSVWDSGTWDAATWGDLGAVGTFSTVQGASGIGSSIATGLRMKTSGYTVFVGFDVAWEEGGLL